MGFAKYMTKI